MLLLGLMFLLVAPRAAVANQSCVGSPGVAARDQLCEAIPGAEGDRGLDDRALTAPAVPPEALLHFALSDDGRGLLAALIDRDSQQAGIQEVAAGSPAQRRTGRAERGTVSQPAAPVSGVLGSVGSAISLLWWVFAIPGVAVYLIARRRRLHRRVASPAPG